MEETLEQVISWKKERIDDNTVKLTVQLHLTIDSKLTSVDRAIADIVEMAKEEGRKQIINTTLALAIDYMKRHSDPWSHYFITSEIEEYLVLLSPKRYTEVLRR